jgi:hypothetical protein
MDVSFRGDAGGFEVDLVALDVVGRLGRVTAAITPGHLGEVVVEVRQGTERFMARSSDSALTIPKHAQVIIVGSLGGRTVEVEPTDTLRLSR